MSSLINARSGHQFFVRGLVVALVAATLAGCSLWSADKSKPVPADLGANVAVLGVRQAWTARLGNVAGFPLEVHVAGNVVTVASADGAVAALDARTGGISGEQRWLSLCRQLWVAMASSRRWSRVTMH